jgi:transposase InsO family protein
MAWKQMDIRQQRAEFSVRAWRGEPVSGLCLEYGISRPTGYLWKQRFAAQGVAGLDDRSRRPAHSPRQTAAGMEARIVELRRARPDWGARKLAVLLSREGYLLPVITVHRVLLRHGLVRPADSRSPATQRFERERPNELWQMDFKGQKESQAAIGPLSVLDDHSRYAVALEQTGTTCAEAVRERLEGVFVCNGVPDAMLMDHGIPWWSSSAPSGWTQFPVWMMKQGIGCHFSAIRHPETQGKVERFHQSLERARTRRGQQQVWLTQSWLDDFRYEYNHLRPHEALNMQTPASRWHPSQRKYQLDPPAWEYGTGAEVRRLSVDGDLYLDNHRWRISQALAGEPVRLERTDQRILIYYCNTLIRDLDLGAQRSTAVDRWAQPPNPTKNDTCKGSPDNTL